METGSSQGQAVAHGLLWAEVVGGRQRLTSRFSVVVQGCGFIYLSAPFPPGDPCSP